MARVPLVLVPGLLNTGRVYAHQVAALSDIADCLTPEPWHHDSIAAMADAALAMARMREVPLQPDLAKVAIPVDVVGGECDALCPKRAADVIIEGLTSAPVRYTEIPGVGHLMSVDDPEGVASALLEILASAPGS